jgi:hypothetical protein
MVIAAPELKSELQPVGEQRVVLRGLSWDAYLQILNALPQSRGARLTYMVRSGGFINFRKVSMLKLLSVQLFPRYKKNARIHFWKRQKRMKLRPFDR